MLTRYLLHVFGKYVTRLTHWGRVTHMCVGNLTITGSDNGLSPGRRQAIIQTNAGILSIGLLGTNFNEISIGIQTFSFKKMHFKMSSAKWRPFCLGLNVLIIGVHKHRFNFICHNGDYSLYQFCCLYHQRNVHNYNNILFYSFRCSREGHVTKTAPILHLNIWWFNVLTSRIKIPIASDMFFKLPIISTSETLLAHVINSLVIS